MPKYGAYDKNDDHTYALGVFPSMELLKARPESVRCLLVDPAGYRNAGVNKLIEACRGRHIPVEEAPRAVERISGKENAWCVTVLSKYDCQLSPARSHVVLHNPSDVGNVGTILRSALGFGFRDVAIIRPGVDPFDPRVLRASMGAAFHLNLVRFDSFEAYCQTAGEREFYLFRLRNARPLADQGRTARAPFSLVFGNEASGLPEELEHFGRGVIIPHSQEIDSLNLAVAAGIGLYAFSAGARPQEDREESAN
ncbi:MAG: TrmH family RNA methyltransferase [Candidatus Spyradocola sp.]|jgi:TrmH family RNA methyltransferase